MSTEAEVKELADLKQWIEEKVRSLEDELALLKKMMLIVDKQLTERSFVKAAEVPSVAKPAMQIERRQLKRQSDGYLLGEAEIYDDNVKINIAQDVILRSSTPPFKSYFIGKILGGMRGEDEKQAEQGKLEKDKVLQYDIEEEGGRIRSITVKGYRNKARLNEILSTAIWTFTRMLEKQA
jgi:hypothetical protein